MENTAKTTPLMGQYYEIKNDFPETILLFRVGDFYETFGEDAVITAQTLHITLTQRGNGAAGEVKLAGFPYHALDVYLPKLIRAGFRVALCEQLEDPKQAKGLVKRGVTQVLTPGVSYHEQVLQAKENNFLAAVFSHQQQWGMAFLDVSTGEFFITQNDLSNIQKLHTAFSPKELLYCKNQKTIIQAAFPELKNARFLEDWCFGKDFTTDLIQQHFGLYSLESFGIEQAPLGILAAGAILQYLKDIQNKNLKHLSKIKLLSQYNYMGLDAFTLKNLEIFQSTHPDGIALIESIDYTKTMMGGRKLRQFLALPLLDQEKIEERLSLTNLFFEADDLREKLQDLLKTTVDIERITGKIATEKIQPRELVALGYTFEIMEQIRAILKEYSLLFPLQLRENKTWSDLIFSFLDPDAPVHIQKGNVIRKNFSPELDELRKILYQTKDYLEELQAKEAVSTQIPSLKINYNQVFGYYIEVRNLHKHKVPEHWIRKQTLSNAERYITPELKMFEEKILHAQDRIAFLEQHYFEQLRQSLLPELSFMQNNAQTLAELDVFLSLGQLAREKKYCRPIFQNNQTLHIEDLRHPVIENQLKAGEKYVPNTIFLDPQNQILLITGPNMGGKSALLRQTGIAVLLAQIGSFVPAKSAQMSCIDQLFTRVGAADQLSKGASTFMVEMNEMAYILNHLSAGSLLLLDEIGRGTSTQDGLALAAAITVYLHEHPFAPKVLFATHYHELSHLEDKYERIKNFHVHVSEKEGQLIFFRKLRLGASLHSFGIEVAQLAGVPKEIIKNARFFLKDEKNQIEKKMVFEPSPIEEKKNVEKEKIIELLEEVNINTLTPLEALIFLQKIKTICDTQTLIEQ